MRSERRGRTALIAVILETARKGATISTLAEKANNLETLKRYLPFLLERGLLRVEKTEEYFLSVNGREYGLLYFTTKKGFDFLRAYQNILLLVRKTEQENASVVLNRFRKVHL